MKLLRLVLATAALGLWHQAAAAKAVFARFMVGKVAKASV